ncbi:MAG: hypothetical protein R6U40_07540 [Desulfobacterales bacterium]
MSGRENIREFARESKFSISEVDNIALSYAYVLKHFLLMPGCSRTQNKILTRHVGFLTPAFLANQFVLFTKHPTLLIF